jgi:hypothetical protein
MFFFFHLEAHHLEAHLSTNVSLHLEAHHLEAHLSTNVSLHLEAHLSTNVSHNNANSRRREAMELRRQTASAGAREVQWYLPAFSGSKEES